MPRLVARVLLIGTLAATAGCAGALKPPSAPQTSGARSQTVTVYGRPLSLHLSGAPAHTATPLVLYATGDGGWFGAAIGMYDTIAASGVNAVGFSTRAFLHLAHATQSPVTAAQLVEGYASIIDAARQALGLEPDTPVVLTGWSRGAALAVLVGRAPLVDPHVVGVVAIGLAARERLDAAGDDDDSDPPEVEGMAHTSPREHEVDVYPLIAQLAPRRCAVIQASHDGYLPAPKARELFGTDSEVKRLITIEARNHRFSGGESAFAEALGSAIRWASAMSFP